MMLTRPAPDPHRVLSRIDDLRITHDWPPKKTYELINDGEIEVVRMGARTLVVMASVAAYVRQRDAHSRRTEEELRARAAELREGDRRKNEFLAVLAHELRNPLAPILNSVEVLRLLEPKDANVMQARVIVERQVKQVGERSAGFASLDLDDLG